MNFFFVSCLFVVLYSLSSKAIHKLLNSLYLSFQLCYHLFVVILIAVVVFPALFIDWHIFLFHLIAKAISDSLYFIQVFGCGLLHTCVYKYIVFCMLFFYILFLIHSHACMHSAYLFWSTYPDAQSVGKRWFLFVFDNTQDYWSDCMQVVAFKITLWIKCIIKGNTLKSP